MPTLAAQCSGRRLAYAPDDALLTRIMGEYLEMPGLSPTARQAQRLWQLDEPTCRRLLGALVDQEFLTITPGGLYVKRE